MDKSRECKNCVFCYENMKDCAVVTKYDFEDEENVDDFLDFCIQETISDLQGKDVEVSQQDMPKLKQIIEGVILNSESEISQRFKHGDLTPCEYFVHVDMIKDNKLDLSAIEV